MPLIVLVGVLICSLFADAVNTALLLLPRRFSSLELYETITSISYSGDPRFAYGMESSDKVRNIVLANPGAFEDLYKDVILKSNFLDMVQGGIDEVKYEQVGTRDAYATIAKQLPMELQRR